MKDSNLEVELCTELNETWNREKTHYKVKAKIVVLQICVRPKGVEKLVVCASNNQPAQYHLWLTHQDQGLPKFELSSKLL